jgi:ornithine cyclodeaminase
MLTAVPYLTEARVKECLDPAALIDAMRQALIDLSGGKANQPLRMVMPFDASLGQPAGRKTPTGSGSTEHGLLFLKPAQLGSAFATKLITLVPSNTARNQPTLLATIVLMDPDTGAATAILEGTTLTAMRTAAVSAVAADALTPAGPKIVTMLGSGVLARSHAMMLRLIRPISEIRIWSRDPNNVQNCAKEIDGRACATAEEAVFGADIVCTVSNASTPILKGVWLKPGAFVAAVGAPRPTWRELDDDAMRNIVIADQRQAAEQESGDVILSKARVTAEIGELLAGTTAMPAAGSTIIFKSLGQAVEDAVAAQLVVHASLKK